MTRHSTKPDADAPLNSTAPPATDVPNPPPTASAAPADRPTGPGRLLLRIGSIGPLGHCPASGTVTVALIGIPGYYAAAHLAPPIFATTLLAFTAFSIWVHHVGDRILGTKDSRKLVLDELVGFWIAVAFLPFHWKIAAIAFLLERTIDITKIPPANWIEKHWPGGWGVVGDDIVAGLYTLALLHILHILLPTFLPL